MKDITDIFKKSAQNIEQKPSPQAWDRLEKRLEQKPSKNVFSIRRIMSIAAAVLALVVVVFVISTRMATNEASMASTDVPTNANFEVEAIPSLAEAEASDIGFYKVVEFQRKNSDRLSNPSFQEGARKRLSVSSSYHNVQAVNNVNQFQWLIGKWKGTSEKTILDEWQQANASTIEGRGFVEIEGEMMFAERMKLQQFGSNIFFMIDLYGSEDMLKYILISYDGNQATFENPKAPFPNQMVLKRGADNSVEFIMQHTSSQPPSKAQVKHLKLRNEVNHENRIIRKMRKVN